jgi:hypothetical protein
VNKLFAATAIAAALAIAGSAQASVNLVQNGDFETAIGNPNTAAGRGFDTDYAFRDGSSNTQADNAHSMYDEGTWTIGTNPFAVHDLWIDQTYSNMLILNGRTHDLPSVAWSQEFAVAGGTYDYAFDVINLYAGPGASHLNFDFSTDGGLTFTNLNAVETQPPGDAGVVWHRSGSFDVAQGTLRVSLRNTMGDAGGNDFGIDNISVSAAVPEPATWGLMLMGFGGLGAMLRANRRRLAFTA